MDIQIDYQSGVYVLQSRQILHRPIQEVWDFFSCPQNLNDMIPNDLKFKITTKSLPQRTYQGQ